MQNERRRYGNLRDQKQKHSEGRQRAEFGALGPKLRGGKGLHDSEEDVKHEKKSRRVPMKEISSPDWLDDPDVIVFATEKTLPPSEESYNTALA